MLTHQLTAAILDAAIEGFEAQKRRIDEQIAQVRQLQNGHSPAGTSEPQKRTRRKMSAAARKRMGEAQRKRWAAKSGAQTASEATAKLKRKLSAAGRAAIVAALKKRWAAKKARLAVVETVAPKTAAPRKVAAKKTATKAFAA
jgi:hypothetical protein